MLGALAMLGIGLALAWILFKLSGMAMKHAQDLQDAGGPALKWMQWFLVAIVLGVLVPAVAGLFGDAALHMLST